jgi:hypothetical protein
LLHWPPPPPTPSHPKTPPKNIRQKARSAHDDGHEYAVLTWYFRLHRWCSVGSQPRAARMTLGREVRQTQQSLFAASYCRRPPRFAIYCRRPPSVRIGLCCCRCCPPRCDRAASSSKRVARKDTRQPRSPPAHYATTTTTNFVSCSPAQPNSCRFTRTGDVPGVCVCVVQPHRGGGLSSCR